MNIKNLGKKALTLGAIAYIGATSIFSKVDAKTKASLDILTDIQNPTTQIIKPSATYDLPLGVKGFSTMNFFENGSYVGKTKLTKNVGYVDLIADATFRSFMNNSYALGASTKIPTPDKTFANVSVYPVSIDSEGQIEDKLIAGLFTSANLPGGLRLSNLTEIDAKNSKWSYGEVDLSKQIKNFKIGSNVALTPKEGLKPQAQYRIRIGYDF